MPQTPSNHADEPRPARRERLRLCDLLIERGPQAPTLCEGWTAHDLVAHLVIRDTVPQALAGLVVPRFHGITERHERRARQRPFADLVAAVRHGPPPFLPLGLPLVREVVNIHEYFVHHEDVRRPAGLGPRRLEPDLDTALWTRLRVLGSQLSRRLGTLYVVAETPDGRVHVLHRGAGGRLTLRGECGELVLYLFNRRSDAVVEATGDTAAIRLLSEVRLGL